ncbi:cysteine-rich receptor-like protein kinase 10 [Typha angustifolia]|uniref:cysteine-rich receptor-like protein kinase 10 n=1 Tax=Typha angustifolia TaxID=59011 RepID=UPI003C2B0342
MYSGVWYEYCFLHYSYQNIFGIADTASYASSASLDNVTEPQRFSDLLDNLMNSLATKAAYNSSLMFAAGAVKFTSSDTVYGLVMCTRDLPKAECFRCLTSLVNSIPSCCDAKESARLSGWNCELRYGLKLFYNASAVDGGTLQPPSPSPSPSPPSEAASPLTPAATGNKGAVRTIVIGVASVVVIALALVIAVIICLRRRKPVKKNLHDGTDEQEIMSSESLLLDFGTLKGATNNFSDANKLGEGGFGPVYKGTLQGGQEVAVKRLSWTSNQGLVELRNEVVLLAKLQHRNLVRLLGFCLQEKEKLLVYEYLPHKSLDKLLFDSSRRSELDWGTRYKIIEGISRGLVYLHEDSRLKIVHRDLKVSNILLDGDMNAKISDFGLAKLVSVDETQRNTSRIAGTFGYMAPEYALHGFYSTKSDVFSYGVLVLEILTGRRNSCYEESGQLVDLLSYVWQHWIEGKGLEVIDGSVVAHCQSQVALRCIHIGLLCVQDEPSERPNMTSIILMLSSSSITLPAPKPPAFLLRSGMTSKPNILDSETSVDSLRSAQFSGGAR